MKPISASREMHVSPQRKGRPYTKRGKVFNNRPIIALVERGGQRPHIPCRRCRSGDGCQDRARERRARKHVCTPTKANSTAKPLMDVRRHKTVKHTAGEYVRGDVHTNTVESYFSIFKRGMRGVYQHCSREASAPLSRGVRFPLQQPHRTWRERCERAELLGHWHRRQAPHLSTA